MKNWSGTHAEEQTCAAGAHDACTIGSDRMAVGAVSGLVRHGRSAVQLPKVQGEVLGDGCPVEKGALRAPPVSALTAT